MEPNSISKPRTSVAAILSLVCGLLGCIPFVTGLAAVILGFVGIKKTRDPMVTGKGMAIAGLILGILSLAGWSVGSATIAMKVYAITQMAKPAQDFSKDLSEGKIDEAMALSVEGTDREALVALSEKMKPWGAFQTLVTISTSSEDVNGSSRVTLGGLATFATGSKNFNFTLLKVGEVYKVEKFDFQ
jgi:Domain of unknown function (DUF4190)